MCLSLHLHPYFVLVSSEDSGESEHMRRLDCCLHCSLIGYVPVPKSLVQDKLHVKLQW